MTIRCYFDMRAVMNDSSDYLHITLYLHFISTLFSGIFMLFFHCRLGNRFKLFTEWVNSSNVSICIANPFRTFAIKKKKKHLKRVIIWVSQSLIQHRLYCKIPSGEIFIYSYMCLCNLETEAPLIVYKSHVLISQLCLLLVQD